MKHAHKHFLARLLVGAFLIAGISFWMTRFVVEAKVMDAGLDINASRVMSIGSTGSDVIYPLQIDINDNLYIGGYFSQEMVFSGWGSIPNLGSTDGFISKLSSGWITSWATGMVGDGKEMVYTTVIDALGNVYVAGTFTNHLTFPSLGTYFASSGNTDMFVAKLSSTGQRLRAQGRGSIGDDRPAKIKIGTNGDIFLVGSINGSTDFPDVGNVPNSDVFVFAMSGSTGSGLYVLNGGSTNGANIFDLEMSGSMGYVVGSFDDSDFDLGGLGMLFSYSGGSDAFIASFSTDTQTRANATGRGGTGYDVAEKLTLDGSGNIYIAGSFDEDMYLDPIGIINPSGGGGNNDIFIGRLQNNFSWNRAMSLGGNGNDDITTLKYNMTDGYLYAGGIFSNTVMFGSESIDSQGDVDGFISQIDTTQLSNPSAAILGTKSFGSVDTDGVIDIAFDSNNTLYVAGIFSNTINLGIRTLTSTGDTDGFIMKFINDTTSPIFSGNAGSTLVTSGGYYTTGVSLHFYDASLSGATLSGTNTSYYSGNLVNHSLITGDGTYVFTVTDYAGHSTGMLFTIDAEAPLFTGTVASGSVVSSGGYYNTTGITITFSDLHLSGATLSGLNGNTYLNTGFLSGTTITTGGTYLFTVYDYIGHATGMLFTIDTINPILTGTYPLSGYSISGNNNTIVFTWTGIETNLSGYTLYISGTSILTYSPSLNTTYSVPLANGNYFRYVIATDKAGNTGTFLSGAIPFSVQIPLTGTIALSGSNLVTSGGIKYTTSILPIYINANTTCQYTITGDIQGTLTGVATGGIAQTLSAIASGTDGIKNIYVILHTGSEVPVITTLTGFLDTTKPADPALGIPTSGATVTGAFTLTWSIATASDTGVGLSGYRWYVSPSSSFSTITRSGYTTGNTLATFADGTLGVATGTFYWKVISFDKLGWIGTSPVQSFYFSGEDLTPTAFTFDRVTDARLDRMYLSSEETILGMSNGSQSLARVSRGVLYINGDEIGETGYVDNNDTVQIELNSSDEYDTTISSTLYIGGFSTTFRVTTRAETDTTNDNSDISTNLSNTEKLQIASVFLALRDLYTDSTTRTTFFNALLTSLQNKIDDLDSVDDEDKINALQYLYDLVENYLGDDVSDTIITNSNRYAAPNGRVYQISYNSTSKTYTSPDFMFKKTFATLVAMKAYIDANNGGSYGGGTSGAGRNTATIDNTWQSAPYTAPNKKVYRLFKTTDGRYSSYTFASAKYFVSVDAMKNYIYQQNR